MLKSICPCLSWLYPTPKKQRSKKQAYRPGAEFEEEQFMHHLQTQAKKSKNVNVNQMISDEISIEEQMEHTLKTSDEHMVDVNACITQNQQFENNSEIQQKTADNDRQPIEIPVKGTKIEEKLQKSYDFTNLGQLQINIPEYDPNYPILKQKTLNAADYLNISKNCTQISLTSSKSQKSSKLTINKSQLRVWRTSLYNCFIIQYQIPCSYAYYNQISNKKIQPSNKNKWIRQYKLVQSIDQNLALRFISFNKIGMLEPRQFTYLKYTIMSTTNPSGHWQTCISRKPQKQPSITPTAKQGTLFSISYIIEQHKQLDQQKRIKIRIRTYINLEINVNVENVWERILKEMKEFVEEMWEDAESNYSEELV